MLQTNPWTYKIEKFINKEETRINVRKERYEEYYKALFTLLAETLDPNGDPDRSRWRTLGQVVT